ncbi:MAG: hypothetical protein FWF76_01725 [Oscillospiraceae bacterium]|nr:hypothetical protein [Oscillospiraceae bacterium]
MPVIPQINNPFQGRGYQSTQGNQNRPGGDQFEIVQLTKPQNVASSQQRDAGEAMRQLAHNREDVPQLMVKTPKDPTMAVETLKQLMSSDLLTTAAANGYTELHGELEALAKSIYLSVGDLVPEMLNQESQTTMFSSDKLFDLMRALAGNALLTGNENSANAIANFLKAVNFSFNRGEILNALAANMRFLSTYFQPSTALSEKLAELADKWASEHAQKEFNALKSDTVKLLYNVSESLLNNEKTQILIPLIIHNLSRYNTNDYMLKDAFSAMMVHVPHSQKGAFMTAFDGFLDAVLNGTFKSQEHKAHPAPVASETAGANSAQESLIDKNSFPAMYAEKLAEGREFPPPGMNRDILADGLRGFLLGKLSGLDAVTTILTNLIEGSKDARMLIALQSDLAKIDSVAMLVDYLNDILKPLPDVPERQHLFEMLAETVSGMAEKGELPAESAKSALDDVMGQTLKEMQNTPAQTQDAAPRAAAGSALEELTRFIEKNINHTALKSLDSYNASNLLQSLINAPGVYTPLSHFVIPLQIGDARAFGELWVDNEDKGTGKSKEQGGGNYHLFLTFEIETVGRFETDLYARGSEVSLAVLHPEGFSSEIVSLKERIAQIIASTDYTINEFQTAILRTPHDLTQIFPNIMEKRTGLDITI